MLAFLLQLVGATTATTILYRLYNFIHLYFLHQSRLPRYLKDGENCYALVTGASDGIGLATAKALQKRGFNIILHGRNSDKLVGLSKEMMRQFPALRVVTVPADATDTVPSIKKIEQTVADVEKSGGKLTVLMNNVGGMAPFGIGPYTSLQDIQFDTASKIVDLNAKFPMLLTRALLPRLVTNAPSLIINVGSYAGVYSMPYITLYSPSKAFNHAFSASLTAEMEVEGTNVEVLGILVGPVKTSGNPDDDLGFGTLTANVMAESIVGRIGCGKRVIAGNWRHCLTGEMLKWFPEKLQHAAMNGEMVKRKERDEKKA